MFKRLLSLIGDKLPFSADARTETPVAAPPARSAVPMVQLPLPPAPVPAPPEPLTDPALLTPMPAPAPVPDDVTRTTVSDAYGRELALARSEWRDKVVKANLERYRNDAESLCTLILEALEEGFEEELPDAAARLVEIDDKPARAHVVHARVLLVNGRPDEAEATLRDGMTKIGEDPELLDWLANVQLSRGEKARACATLWQAVEIEPGKERVDLLLELEKAGSEAGYRHALERVAVLPGAWRVVLMLAHQEFHADEDSVALGRIDRLLAERPLRPEVDEAIVALLVANGQDDALLARFVSRYDALVHSDALLESVLQLCHKEERWRDGLALVARRDAAQVRVINPVIDTLAEVFTGMRNAAEPPPVDKPAAPQAKVAPVASPSAAPVSPAVAAPVEPTPAEAAPPRLVANADSVTLVEPVWSLGLSKPEWLLQPKPAHAPVAVFFNLAQAGGARIARDDETARLSRAIPLYLAEATHFWTDYSIRAQFPLVKGSGPMVPSVEPDGASLCDSLPGNVPSFVTGTIAEEAEGWSVTINLWDRMSRKVLQSDTVLVPRTGQGKVVQGLEERLLRKMGAMRRQPHDGCYLRPPVEVMDSYLAMQSRSFMQALLAAGQAAPEAVRDERQLLEDPLALLKAWPWSDVPGIHFLSTLGLAIECRSPLVPEYAERSMALLEEARASRSLVARLAPFVWHIYGHEALWEANGGLNPSGQSHAYRQWLARVAARARA